MGYEDIKDLELLSDGKGNNPKTYRCPLCDGEIEMVTDTFFGRCDTCAMTLIDYVPEDHQKEFHESKATIKLNIGGYGTGKTTMACAEMVNHLLTIPGARFLITAPILSQIVDAVLPELDKLLPPWLLEKPATMKPKPYYKLKNGSEILVYASDDENKMKSLNLTGFYIEEASSTEERVFTQLQTRLRNITAVVYDEDGFEIDDHFVGIISSNPEDCWFVDRILLKSGTISCSRSVDQATYDVITKGSALIPFYHSFLSSSRDNKYLPATYIKNLCAGHTPSWIRKYVDCYLGTKEGAVLPTLIENMIEPFQIPDHWLRVVGFDKGFRDPTAWLIGAIDPMTNVVYIYKEYYVAEQPITYHAIEAKNQLLNLNLFNPIQADPSIRNRNENNGETYQDYFYQLSGIYLNPANNDIFYGLERIRDYIYTGKLKFFNNLTNLKDEALKYVYKDKKDGSQDTPIDKFNHLIDSLRYLVTSLPENPNELRIAINNSIPTVRKAIITKNGLEYVTSVGYNDYDENEYAVFEDEDGFKTEGGVTSRW